MNLSRALRVLRAWLSLTQRQLAAELGTSEGAINRAEGRRGVPLPPKVLERLNERYGAMLPSMGLRIEHFLTTKPQKEASEVQDGL